MPLDTRHITSRSLNLLVRLPKCYRLNRRFCNKPDSAPNKRKGTPETGSASSLARNKLVQQISQIAHNTSTTLQQKGGAVVSTLFDKFSSSISAFDDVLGISEVRDAQSNVRKAEDEFMSTRKRVQTAKKELEFIHSRLADIRRRLDRTPRDDERYLALATEEHRILLEEKKFKVQFGEMENLERDQFAALSGVVRDSHEKERARAERTKYWSVVGSVMGAALGIIGSSVMNYVRLKEIKSSVKGTGQSLMDRSDELKEIITVQDSSLARHNSELKETIISHKEDITERLSDLRDAVDTYALSASIGTDIGTIEAGISLKTLTAQLRELVQLQLASERARGEGKGSGEAEFQSLLEELEVRQTELKGTLSDILSNFKAIQESSENQKAVLEDMADKSPALRLGNDGSVCYENHQPLEDAKWWARAGAITSLSFGIASLAAVLYEILR